MREIVEDYMDAMQRGDVDAVVAMLAEDADVVDAAAGSWFGVATGSCGDSSRPGRYRASGAGGHIPTRVNGQAAVGSYAGTTSESAYRPFALDVLTVEGERITEVTSFINRSTESEGSASTTRSGRGQALDPDSAAAFERFGLPAGAGLRRLKAGSSGVRSHALRRRGKNNPHKGGGACSVSLACGSSFRWRPALWSSVRSC